MYCVGPFGNEAALVVIGVAPCPPDTMVILTSSELLDYQTASPWFLSLADGGLIAAAILGVWAIAFSLRMIRSALNSADPE